MAPVPALSLTSSIPLGNPDFSHCQAIIEQLRLDVNCLPNINEASTSTFDGNRNKLAAFVPSLRDIDLLESRPHTRIVRRSSSQHCRAQVLASLPHAYRRADMIYHQLPLCLHSTPGPSFTFHQASVAAPTIATSAVQVPACQASLGLPSRSSASSSASAMAFYNRRQSQIDDLKKWWADWESSHSVQGPARLRPFATRQPGAASAIHPTPTAEAPVLGEMAAAIAMTMTPRLSMVPRSHSLRKPVISFPGASAFSQSGAHFQLLHTHQLRNSSRTAVLLRSGSFRRIEQFVYPNKLGHYPNLTLY
ncbi:unnamed protein product [Protopolystoma xenopodis]|uniref:Uncharacterized protein n=1 Tax=Protopolystoma xenopodis TaxID=117903 RepID=A0A448X4R4_9PLAT|nr:unnamed protein product [Protopolystoma xenopodis]